MRTLAARPRRQWAFDAFVALATMATVVLRAEAPQIDERVAVFEMLLALPLVLRRVFPSSVLALVVLGVATMPLWSDPTTPSVAVLVALYTVAANQSRLRAAIAAVATGAAVFLVLGGDRVPWPSALAFATTLTVSVLALGLWIGTRRSYLAELRDRAERLERERDQQHELAVATERARMTREMHDIVAHHLTVVVALSDAAARTAVKAPEQAADVMRKVSATGRQALAETRRVLTDPDATPGSDRAPVPGLNGVDALLDRVRTAGLPVSYQVTGDLGAAPVESGVQLAIYRLVQEALTNTLKHAGPGATATVRLGYAGGGVTAEIEDDGGGRAARPAPERGVGRGLTGMRERVNAYGGEVESGPRRPVGWRVAARIGTGEQVTS